MSRQLAMCWTSMHHRCYNPKDVNYLAYGGRGIKVSEAWALMYDFIVWATSNGYTEGLQIDRIDNDGDYSPDNCRFVTGQVNSNNRRSNRKVTAFNKTLTLADWARDPICVVTRQALRMRLDKGWKVEAALTQTPHRGVKEAPQRLK